MMVGPGPESRCTRGTFHIPQDRPIERGKKQDRENTEEERKKTATRKMKRKKK